MVRANAFAALRGTYGKWPEVTVMSSMAAALLGFDECRLWCVRFSLLIVSWRRDKSLTLIGSLALADRLFGTAGLAEGLTGTGFDVAQEDFGLEECWRRHQQHIC